MSGVAWPRRAVTASSSIVPPRSLRCRSHLQPESQHNTATAALLPLSISEPLHLEKQISGLTCQNLREGA
eukprot:3399014-Amphidinium_carterae.1